VKLRSKVDIALRLAQGAEELSQVLRIGIAVDHGGNHEGRVDDFAETKLLGEVIRPAEQIDGRRRALEQQFHALEQHAVGVGKVDLLRLEILLQRLNGGVMA